jgi:hypothetical protein
MICLPFPFDFHAPFSGYLPDVRRFQTSFAFSFGAPWPCCCLKRAHLLAARAAAGLAVASFAD